MTRGGQGAGSAPSGGASAVAVPTPAANDAAAAFCRSAGSTVVRDSRDWTRPGRALNTAHQFSCRRAARHRF